MLPLPSAVRYSLLGLLLFQCPPSHAQLLDDALLRQLGLAGMRIEPGPMSDGPAAIVPLSTPTLPTSTSTSASVSVTSTTPVTSTVSTSVSSSQSSEAAVPTTVAVNATNATNSTSTGPAKRALLQCLKTSVEGSCTNLAANCLDSVNDGNRNNLWGIRSCVLAATCYGVGDLISSVRCQTGFTITNADQGSLDYNIYAAAVGDCAWAPGGCPVTQQNFIDWYYTTLSLINTSSWPSSVDVVIGYWSAIRSWTATGDTVPYVNLNDWYHFSSFPTTPPTTTTNVPVYTPIAWNPNPIPPVTAVSQTFVAAGTTVVIPKPTTVTVTVTVAGSTLTVAPGGQVVGTVPTGVSQPEALPPVWNNNPIIPTTTGSATFISGTWTSIVAVPTSTDTPVTVNGPPDDGDDDDSNDSWLLVLLALLLGGGVGIVGSVPATVAVIGAVLPAPVPPPGWPEDGPWVPPVVPPPPGGNGPTEPDPDDPDDDDGPDDPDVCYWTLPPFDSPYDGESGPDPDEDEDEVFARRAILDYGNYGNSTNTTTTFPRLFRRADTRKIRLGSCNEDPEEKSPQSLLVSTWYSINNPAVNPPVATSNTALYTTVNARHTSGDGRVKEHLFEFQYIAEFFREEFPNNADCTWLKTDVWDVDPDGNGPLRTQMITTIDQRSNMVWADRALNRAKSYVVNNDRPLASLPPFDKEIKAIANLQPGNPASRKNAGEVQILIRAFGGLAQYFNLNAAELRNTGARVQRLLALVTPTAPLYPPLDTRFNNFLSRTYGLYTARTTSRGINMLNAFNGRLDTLLAQASNTNPPPTVPPVVPQCWPVYHDQGIVGRILGSSINAQALVPAPIPHPPCNTAGETGSFILFDDANGGGPVLYAGDPQHKIQATGTVHLQPSLDALNAKLFG
ncbi:hypothetical protein NLJ89_g7013 [Agrocybe chaxingu]|uniref:Uncharacterized protein n=1 Tax=Agrocybe chaxingu TaxID=84603 RepID=A0A9W8MTI7_9AGAR|nr:hypothetical protein NLJ89_g7013 [Agrocybe chaxingu]